MRERSGKLLAALARAIGIDEVLLLVGLALLTVGLWAVVGASALVAPGVTLIWIALPQRASFLPRPDPPAEPRRKR